MKLLIALVISLKSILPQWPSIVPLQTALGSNFCTSFSINQPLRYYMTAAHCVAQDDPEIPTPHIDLQRVKVVFYNKDLDIAIVQGALGRRALVLASEMPKQGASVLVVGFPYGWDTLSALHGHLIYPYVRTRGGAVYAVYNTGCAGGNSGSPVLNERGEVISVLQVGWQSGNFCGGAPWIILSSVTAQFWEKQ